MSVSLDGEWEYINLFKYDNIINNLLYSVFAFHL